MAVTCTGIALSAIGCEESLSVAAETPPRAFVLGRVHIDDRQPNGSSWVGTAQRAEGSLEESDFQDLELTLTTGEQRIYSVRAPSGTMNFDAQKGVFQNLVVTDDQGGVLTAGVGYYDGEAGTLTTEGPMEFTAQDVTMRAPRGVIDLESGAMTVEGPVKGRYVNSPPPAPP